jgi:hypothetical protein
LLACLFIYLFGRSYYVAQAGLELKILLFPAVRVSQVVECQKKKKEKKGGGGMRGGGKEEEEGHFFCVKYFCDRGS